MAQSEKKNNKPKSLEDILKENGFIIYSFKGISMLPLLEQGKDTVRIEKITDEIKPLDVLLYKSSTTGYTLHRFINKQKNKYNMVGDNCNKGELVSKNRIIGRMVGYYKNKEYIEVTSEIYQTYLKDHILGVDYQTRELIDPPIPASWLVLFDCVRKGILGLRSEKNSDNDSNINWNDVYRLAKIHSITALIAPFMDKTRVDKEIYDRFYNDYNNNMRRTVIFDAERNKLMKQFEEEEIDYCYLKGIITNKLYPVMGAREFADNDILIRDKDSEKIYELMTKNGYTAASLRGVHDSYHKDPFFNFEFHRELFNEEFEFSKYYNDIWDRVKPSSNGASHHFELSLEDFYLHHIAHFYKHYVHGGAGIRPFIDTYLINEEIKKHDEFKREEVDKILIQNKLKDFENEVNTLIDKMFIHPESLRYIDVLYIMESGAYGIVGHHIKNELGKKNGKKVSYLLSRIFLPYRTMKTVYPVLDKCPILLPFCYLLRFFKPIVNKEARDRTKNELTIVKEYKQNNE